MFDMEYAISDLCANKIDGHRFIEWRTRSDFECQACKGDVIRVSCKNINYKGILSDFDENGLYLRTGPLIGAPQIHIMYGDVLDIEQTGKSMLI